MKLFWNGCQKIILTLFICIILSWALLKKIKPNKIFNPHTISTRSNFFKNVKNGDLIGTLANNNVMSKIQSFFLKAPITHTAIALVENEGTDRAVVYLFEMSCPRGAQLRNLENYMRDGAERIWWRPLKANQEIRNTIVKQIEKFSLMPYDAKFLQNIPKEIFGIEAPAISYENSFGFSCADLIVNIYVNCGIMKINNKSFWMPSDYFEKNNYFVNEKIMDPIHVTFF
jgi:hypothetical protein